MKEGLYYNSLEDRTVNCRLCPHDCHIPNNGRGICRVRKNINGKLYTENYGKITGYSYDLMEKKPLYHFYPGREIFSIGSFGCNLACDFCQNWQIVYDSTRAIDIPILDLVQLAKSKDSIGMAYTYNEPSIWYEYILDLSKEIKKEGLKNVLITNGFIQEEPLKELLPYIDALNIDLKSMDNDFYKRICKGTLDPVLRTIETSYKYSHIEITTLIIQGENSTKENIGELAKWISSIDKSIPLHLSRYFPNYKMKLPATEEDILLESKEVARKYLDYVYIGNLWPVDNTTYCPNCNEIIVERHMRGRIIGLNGDKCRNCDKKINIIY